MRFLLDENLPARVAGILTAAGHNASHVFDHSLGGSPDESVMALARRERCILITYDADFAAMAVLAGEALPSIVLFRDHRSRPEELVQMLLDSLGEIEQSLAEGAIAVFDPARVRVRDLPIEPN